MAWIALALRKQSLKAQINELNYEDIQLSRKKRAVHRHLSRSKAEYNADKKAELRDIKSEYLETRNKRPEVSSDDYNQWASDYAVVKEDYESRKADIEDYYDDLNEDIEAEAQEEEDYIDEEITRVEAQRDAMNAELNTLNDSIKTYIESDAIKL